MPSFDGALVIVAVAFAAPFLLGLILAVAGAEGAALIAAGLVSVLAFPVTGLSTMQRRTA